MLTVQLNCLDTFPKEPLYVGSQWFILHRDFCEYLVTEQNVRKLLSFFHTTQVPDESFFSTVIMNSKFGSTVQQKDSHYVAWGRPNMRIWEKDLPGFLSMQQFFVRKVYTKDVQDAMVKILNKSS